jgi:hypothetical protein
VKRITPYLCSFLSCCLIQGTLFSQQRQALSARDSSGALFVEDSVLRFKLSGDIRALLTDRGERVRDHPLVLSYQENDSTEVSMDLVARTRGHFRRLEGNCTYPPILLHFQKDSKGSFIFGDQYKLKLVCPCRGEDYVIREYLVYKLYNLLTPKSFRARLARVNLYDTKKKKEASFYGMLLEEDGQMAKRNHSMIIKKKMLHGENTDTHDFLKMVVFQYLIGNTDWSVEYFQNTRLIALDSTGIPSVVPYDFDHAGIVNAPYASPAEELGLRSVRERRYRGYCIPDMKAFDEVLEEFNRLRKDFYKVYTECPMIDGKYLSATLRFLDQFYDTINDPRKLSAEFSYPCNKGVPNIVIRGLKN